jgi:Ca-activated chloride channel family protein
LAPGAAPIAATPDGTPAQIATATAPDDEPDPNRPWIEAATASDYTLIGDREQMFGVFVEVPKGLGAGHVPTALTLVVDTSGSMRGDKIQHAREAARRIVEELEDGDRVGIVTFAGHANVLASPTVIDAHSRRAILNTLEELTADGGTAMHDGLKVAESQMWSTPDTHLVRRLVMISDGKATVGPTAPTTLGQIAELGLQKGIQVTSIGVGLDYDEATLDELAIRSSGRLYHVEDSRQLAGIVEEEIALLESTAAANAEVELVAAPGVTLMGTDTSHARRDGEKLIVPLGTMFNGQQREILVRAHVDGTEEGSRVLASVRLHFSDPADGGVPRVQETVLRTTITDDPSLVAAHHNSRMQTLLAMREASSWTQLASAQVNRGDFDGADVELARAENRLREQAKKATSKRDRKRAMDSAEQIAVTRGSMAKAKKAPAPARATAGRKAALDLNDQAMSAAGF